MIDVTTTQRRPIGFWLKLLDRLIEQQLDATLASEPLTRREWQILNAVRQGAAAPSEVDERLRPFLDAAEPTTAPFLDRLRRRALITSHPLALTPDGEATVDRLTAQVSAARRALMNEIGAEEYAATVAVLERMARNLGWDSER